MLSMEYFFALIVIAVIYTYIRSQGRAKMEREQAARKSEIARLGFLAQSYSDRMSSVKTPAAQVNNAQKALSVLHEAGEYQECREVIKNYDEIVGRLDAIIRVAPVIAAMDRAYKHKFKGSQKSELNALLDALYEIRKNNVNNADILSSGMMPDGTGEIVQIENIERRCRELGWDKEAAAQ